MDYTIHITNEVEYQIALDRVDEIIDAELDTTEGKELDLLTIAIMRWEQQYE